MITRDEIEQCAIEAGLGEIEIVEHRIIGVRAHAGDQRDPTYFQLYAGQKNRRRFIEIPAHASREHLEQCLARMQ